ncbi:MAG: DUF4340 domain-containing protein [Chitinophagales bacterium]
MKRNLLYLIIVLLLAAAAYFTLIRKKDSSYGRADKEFAVKDTMDMQRIVLSTLGGDTISLERNKTSWTLNGKYKPRPDAIKNLVTTMQQIEVSVPVASSMFENVVRDISAKRTKVEVYNDKGKKIRGYYVGENTETLNGTFMLMEGSKYPFVVNVPGFTGYASAVYFTNINEWRSREVFAYTADEIDQIDVHYNVYPDSSFTIARGADGEMEVLSHITMNKKVNPEIIQYYFKQFGRLNAENFILEDDKRDSLLQVQPACIITVTDKNHVSKSLNIYYRPVTYRSKTQFTSDDKPIEFDLDKYYGIFNDNEDLAIIQNFVFGKLLIGPNFFFRNRTSAPNTLNQGQ